MEIGIGLAGNEAGALLSDMRQLAVAKDMGLGVLLYELFQERAQRGFLGLGAGVGSNAFFVQATLIGNAQRAVVVVAGMHTLHVLGQQGFDAAVTTDVVMIAHLTETGLARGDELLGAEGKVALRGGAVHNDEFYRFQFFHFTQIIIF